MQREIKFRGQRIDTKQWVYGLLITNHLGAYIITEDNPHECHLHHYIEIDEYYKVIPETVGQSTGLKDKNGKEIYEGDIVKFEDAGEEGYEYKEGFDFENTASICFNDGRFELDVFADRNSGVLEDTDSQEELLTVLKNCEVIGNIYDNPELLEASE